MDLSTHVLPKKSEGVSFVGWHLGAKEVGTGSGKRKMSVRDVEPPSKCRGTGVEAHQLLCGRDP
jgi:hypothetical protein